MPRGGDGAREFVYGGSAADPLELAAAVQVFSDGQLVGGLVFLVQRAHRRVDHAVALAVEVRGLEALLNHERV